MSGPGRWILPAAIAVVFAVTAGKRVVPSLSGANLEWTLDLAAAAGCGFLIRYGFRTLREKNMIENVPSSPIRSVAMGLSEIKGHAPAQATLSAPLSSAPCHYFRYQVEEERSRGKGGKEWVTVDQGESNVPFHVEDPTGRILVNPAGAELLLKRDYERIEPGAGWFGKRKRYREWRIDPTEFVYTLGTVSKLRDEISEGREHLREKLQQAKRDPETIKRFDLDGSGALDEQEWAGAVAVIKDDLMREEAARPAEEPQSNLVVGKGDLETTFIISDRDERSIAASLGWRALAGILLGGAGALLMIVSILGRFGVMPGGWGFPWEKLFN
jgi:hypothetical protein